MRPIVVTLAALLLILAASTVAEGLLAGQVCVSAMIQDATSATYYGTVCY